MGSMNEEQSFALTGCGMITGAGVGYDASLRALAENKGFARDLGGGRRGVVAPELDPTPFLYQRKALKFLDRRGKQALQAAREAVGQAGKPGFFLPDRCGVSLAVGMPEAGEEQLADVFDSEGSESIVSQLRNGLNPLWLLGRLPNMPASHLSIQFQARGPVLTSLRGGQALQDAMDCIADGEADAMLVGATEAWFSPVGLAAMEQEGSRVRGEAAVMLVLESMEHARRRGASLLGTLTQSKAGECPDLEGLVENCFGYCGCVMDLLVLALSPRVEGTGAGMKKTGSAVG